MNPKIRIAGACYLVSAISFLAIGLAFVSASEFFPFHSDVIQRSWAELSESTQILYLGMMRTEGAGYLASAVALFALLLVPFRRNEVWACWAMTMIGLVEHLPTFLANLHVSQATPASPPWQAVGMGMAVLVVGLALGLSGMREERA